MKPILFNTKMVKAILDGRKTQTRRVMLGCTEFNITTIDGLYNLVHNYKMSIENVGLFSTKEKMLDWFSSKYSKYKKGDILYVRETFKIVQGGAFAIFRAGQNNVDFESEETLAKEKWNPSIHMPKEYARIFLKVTNVRVERLQDIEHEDILSEGMDFDTYEMQDTGKMYSNDTHGEVDYCEDLANEWWKTLWNSTAKDGYKWADNPYVFVYEFERVEL